MKDGYNIFLHFLYGPYLVVFKNYSLCKMGDNEIYSKKKTLQISGTFVGGLTRSVLRIKACASWGIMSQYSKITPLQMNANAFWYSFVVVLSGRIKEWRPVQDGG